MYHTQRTQGINIYKYNNYHVTTFLFIYIMYTGRSPGLLGPTEQESNNGQENNTFTLKVFSNDTWNHLTFTSTWLQMPWTQLMGQASQWHRKNILTNTWHWRDCHEHQWTSLSLGHDKHQEHCKQHQHDTSVSSLYRPFNTSLMSAVYLWVMCSRLWSHDSSHL